ncbi:MAG: PEP-CTERM sorting domain-containing protein [Lentisphaeraceae bacterium]|nr:PEP-CTERM sorting domain-containing protein [Lentisphaeraceae bacterium]
MMKKLITVMIIALISHASAATVYLDADTVATGSDLQNSILNTSLGSISFSGEVRQTADNELIAAGSVGNVFNIVNQFASLDFSFEAESISFIYGGNGGIFEAQVRDINGNILDSISTLTGSESAGPITLFGQGIRSLTWNDDPNWTFAAIDNVTISSATPEPSSYALMLIGLLGLVAYGRRQRTQVA